MAKGFVYCWTDHLTGKLYVGSHKGNPTDGYICSSKYMKEQYNSRPQDFTRQIVAQGEYIDMFHLEGKILQSEDAAHNPIYYNQHNNNGEYYLKAHTEEANKKRSEKLKGKPKSDLHKLHMKGCQLNKVVSYETKEKCRLANLDQIPWNKDKKNCYNDEQLKRVKDNRMKGLKIRWSTEEQHKKHSDAMKAKAKPIRTPFGDFLNIRDASEKLQIKYNTLRWRVSSNRPGWEFI